MAMHHTEYDELSHLVGGKFKLTVLIQKRMRELNRGARPLVKLESDDHTDIVIAEIRDGLIQLSPGEDIIHNLKTQAEGEGENKDEAKAKDKEKDKDKDKAKDAVKDKEKEEVKSESKDEVKE